MARIWFNIPWQDMDAPGDRSEEHGLGKENVIPNKRNHGTEELAGGAPKRIRDDGPRSRNRGCSYLAERFPLPGDDEDITFEETSHTYTFRGRVVEKSSTGVLHTYFDEFDGKATIAQYYERWKALEDVRYWSIIQHTMRDVDDSMHLTDAQAKEAILERWSDEGKRASELGTQVHLYCERVLNAESGEWGNAVEHSPDIQREATQFKRFLKSTLVVRNELEPLRTELLVWYTIGSKIVSAGQIDALFVARTSREIYLIDWKRVRSKYSLDPQAVGFLNRCGYGLCSRVPDTRFHKYSLQCSLYAEMLQSAHGIDVGGNLYIVRMHAEQDEPECVQCHNYRQLACQMLLAEYQRVYENGV